MKAVLWIGDESNQRALANKIASVTEIAGIVLEKRKRKKKPGISQLFQKSVQKVFLRKIGAAWFGMKKFYDQKYPAYPAVPVMRTDNINKDEVYEFTVSHSPDLIIVSGTSLIRKKLLSIKPPIGIVNLHTGLSPYIKGGPNCTNWCIATAQFHLIGKTVMWIDEGIDTGNIISTELTPLQGKETLADIHLKVMEHAHNLYVRCIRQLLTGKKNNVPQHEVAQGTTYYTKQWNLGYQFKLLRRMKKFRAQYSSGEVKKMKDSIKTIPF
jgi:methionyl-tRNA formyltransferase